MEQQSFHLRTVVEEALELLAPRASEKGLELAYWIEEDVPATIVGDITRLRQVLVNLLSNAVKFTERGEVIVTVENGECTMQNAAQSFIEQSALPHPLSSICFSVRDTGIGIPADRLDRLFKPFTQVDASTTRKYGGTGLGLAISKRLTELMGGRMWVESEAGKGSTFFFTVTTERGQATPDATEVGISTTAVSNKRVLVVAEHAVSRDILCGYATRWNMHVQAVSSLTEAEQALDKGEVFHIALLDLHLPQAEITATIQTLTQKTANQHVTLAILALLPAGTRVNPDSQAGGTRVAFLTKPIRPYPLARMLVSLLEGYTPAKKRSDEQPAEQLPGKQHPLRILLAEDNIINQKVAVRFLERLGYLPDVAANGLEVLDAIRQRAYDVILMDVQMPEMDGIETTQHIRTSLPPHQQPYIIAMTAHAMEGDREWCLEAGMDDYTCKPIVINDLVQKLRNVGRGKERGK